MASKDLLLEYRELEKKGGFIIKEVKGVGGCAKYKTAHISLCGKLIGKKIKISLVKEDVK
jgi:hypothetical protein